ncbi:hypothetical protein CPAV1605_1519 [seawater metagenome]|uniref:Uncharacterized protein n=1 Tax=seawater metagenome TaxID=1561972 RepID=A0A5E8CK24_9ZZZZ
MDHIGHFLFESLKFKYIQDGIIQIKCNEDKIIILHKCICRKSPFLNNILMENPNEIEIILPLEYRVMKEIRDCMYLNSINLSNSNYQQIYKGADFLGIDDIQLKVIEWSINYNLSNKTILNIDVLVKSFGLSGYSYLEIINDFMEKNIEEILEEESILKINKKRLKNLFQNYPRTCEENFCRTLIKWINENNESSQTVNEFLDEEIIIPSLLPVSYLWTDFFPFLSKYGFPDSSHIKWNIMEMACFFPIHQMNTKYIYQRYEWALNLKVGQEFDFYSGNYKWVHAYITHVIKVNTKNKYERINNVTIRVPCIFMSNTVKIKIPQDICKMDFLFHQTEIWKKDLKVNDYVEVVLPSKITIGKIIIKREYIVIIQFSDNSFIKHKLTSDLISNTMDTNIPQISQTDILNNKNFDKMEEEKLYYYNELFE